jgi:hypothetical protein
LSRGCLLWIQVSAGGDKSLKTEPIDGASICKKRDMQAFLFGFRARVCFYGFYTQLGGVSN